MSNESAAVPLDREGNPKVWMDRILYFADGRTERCRQLVPSCWCKHDDGDCHEDNPCSYCPLYGAGQQKVDASP